MPAGENGPGGIYTLERPVIHDAIDGLWTAICAMTTVGYGRKYPRTAAGRFVTFTATLFGMIYLTMPLTIIQWRFQVEMARRNDRRQNEAENKAFRDTQRNFSKLSFRHILKAKQWAKRARLRLRGHSAHHEDEITTKKAVTNYTLALHELVHNHDYADIQRFKQVHSEVVKQVLARMSRGMRANKHFGYWRFGYGAT